MEISELRKEFIERINKERSFNIPEDCNAQHDPDYADWLESKLCHVIDNTHGLYAIDFNPKELVQRFVNSQSDACSLAADDLDNLIKDWEKWINNENIKRSPFSQIEK